MLFGKLTIKGDVSPWDNTYKNKVVFDFPYYFDSKEKTGAIDIFFQDYGTEYWEEKYHTGWITIELFTRTPDYSFKKVLKAHYKK